MTTSHDVAKLAGVSQSTVSRALRGLPGISEKTRLQIQRAAEMLAYVPSDAGRSLSTKRTRVIGVVSAELTNPFFPELVEPMRAEFERLGYRMLLIPDSSENPLEIDRLADGTLDGVILTTVVLGSQLPHRLAARKIPFVLANREIDGIQADTVVLDNQLGGKIVASLLADLGHEKVAAILGPADTSVGRDRGTGFQQGLSERRIALLPERVRNEPFTYSAGHKATIELLAAAEPPTAIFCGNDVIAFGACNAVASLGLIPGHDITIIGFDNIEMSDWDLFRITTVNGDLKGMAENAARLLIRRIASPDGAPERITLEPELILRATHAPPLGMRLRA
ncbi:MAG: LacI family transcriptional regulator [Subtercola sp.]|nr:LacI family transcriptional regulator [Subtercola sp.]